MYFDWMFVHSCSLIIYLSRNGIYSQDTWNTNVTIDHKSIGIQRKYIEFENRTEEYTSKVNALRKYTLDEKCERGLDMGIGFQVYTPYVNGGYVSSDQMVISGIFPHVLNELMAYCCPHSEVGYAKLMSSILEIEEQLHEQRFELDISFPVYGLDGPESMEFQEMPFIPIVTAPKIVLIIPDKLLRDLTAKSKVVLKTISNAWPMLVFICVSAGLAGLLIWVLDRKQNANEFPPSFFTGAWEGMWWAFVSMTTVGYGDRSPRSMLARFFCIMWILLGITLTSLFTGLLSAALNASSTPVFNIPGSKLGAVNGSVEYQVGVGLNADMKNYPNHAEMLSDLLTSKIEAAMIDNFILSANSKAILQNNHLRMAKEMNHPVTYGLVMADNSTATEKCFRKYLRHHPDKLFEMIADNLVPVKNPTDDVRVQVVAAEEKLFYEQQAFKNVVYIELGLLCCAIAVGVVWEARFRSKNTCYPTVLTEMKRTLCAKKKTEDATERYNVSPAILELLNEYDDFHSNWIDRLRRYYARSREVATTL